MGACKGLPIQSTSFSDQQTQNLSPAQQQINNQEQNPSPQCCNNSTHSINQEIFQKNETIIPNNGFRQAISIYNSDYKSEQISYKRITNQSQDVNQLQTASTEHKIEISHDYLESFNNLGKQERNKLH